MKKILILAHDIYEDLELWYPKIRLEEEGYQTTVAGPKKGAICTGKHGYPCKADISFQEMHSSDFDAVVIPGGFAPDKLRREKIVLQIISEMNEAKKPIAFICHAGWVPISAKIVKNRKVTSFFAIRDDLENAGAIYIDKAVVRDENLISSRTPEDLPFFVKELILALK